MYTFPGPVIKAEVGERIRVTFQNKASRPFSIQAHGVSYSRSQAGTRYGSAPTGEPRVGAAASEHTLSYLPTVKAEKKKNVHLA